MPLVVTLHSHSVVYVATPKVASTTLLGCLLDLAAYPGDCSNPQRVFYRSRRDAPFSACGIERFSATKEELVDHQEKCRDYHWMSPKFNPTGRLVS